MGNLLRVLNVEDSEDDALRLRGYLADAGYDLTFERVDTGDAMIAALARQEWDIVIANDVMPQFSAFAALSLVQERRLDVPFIVLSEANGEETAAAIMDAGAHDFLTKQCFHHLISAVQRELRYANYQQQCRRAEHALRETEERFRLMVETTRDKIFLYRFKPTPGYEYVNPAATAIFGYTPEDHYADPDLAFKMVYSDDRALLEGLMQDPVAYNGQPLALRWIRKDGVLVWVELRVIPVYDAVGDLVAIQGVSRDVTERKRVEEERAQLLVQEQAARREAEIARHRAAFLATASRLLAASLEYEATLMEVARLVVSVLADWCLVDIVDEDGSIRRVAAAHADPAKEQLVRQLCRYPPDLRKGEGVPKVLHTGQSLLVSEVSHTLMEAAAQSDEHRQIGRELGAQSAMVVPLRARGRILGALTFVSAQSNRRYDPADLALAEELADRAALAVDNARLYRAVETQGRRMLAIVEQIPAGVIIAEASDGYISLWNSAAQRLIDRSLLGQNVAQWGSDYILRPDGQCYPFEDILLVRALRGETVMGAEVALPRAAGPPLVLLVNAAPILDERSRIIAAVSVFQDITQRKSVEQMKDEFLSLASHELKTPIAAMKGYSQLLLHRAKRGRITLEEQDAETLTGINEKANYVTGLVNELLDVSRIETGRLALTLAPMDLTALLREVRAVQQQLYPERRFRLVGADQPVQGTWDRGRLEQVFTNLMDNAVKYSRTNCPVTVRLCAGFQRTHVEVVVQDRGIGIPAEDIPHLFERHFRGSNVGLAPSGLGLGLYLASQIVMRHGGHIWAESNVGQGSRFHVTLPLENHGEPFGGALMDCDTWVDDLSS